MTAITAQLVKQLREKTGVGMMECKKALAESGGDSEKAVLYLRKQGLSAASRKQSRVASDGLIVANVSADQHVAALLEINSETDFVAKNPEFTKFADHVVALVTKQNPKNVDDLLKLALENATVEDQLNLLVAKIGEKISIRRFVRRVINENEVHGSYVHLGGKIGVIVTMAGKDVAPSLVRDVAMHVAACNPAYLNPEEIPAAVIAREKEIYQEQLKNSGKPANIMENILAGKIAKFATEICLNEQIFIKDPTGKKTVKQLLKETNPGGQIVAFTRFQVGEGMEKKPGDFAKEVAAMAK